MSNTASTERSESELNTSIDSEVGKLVAAKPLDLPEEDAEITTLFVKKIKGTYSQERAKEDADYHIDLLYFIYNATPKTEDNARIRIAEIMNRFINTYQQSELSMAKAMRVADSVFMSLRRVLPDWLEIRDCKDSQDAKVDMDLKSFVGNDLLDLAKKINEQALAVKAELDSIPAAYDALAQDDATIKDTIAMLSKDETPVAGGYSQKGAAENEIALSRSIANFMSKLSDQAMAEIGLFGEKIGMSAVSDLVRSADLFFLRQAAEWSAVKQASEKQHKLFAESRSRLNMLRGKYLAGDELKTYLEEESLKFKGLKARSREGS